MDRLIKVLVRLELFSGKNMLKNPIYSKYRPIFDFKGARTKISGRIDLIEGDSFSPGSSGIVQVTFIKGMISDEHLKKGTSFTISEGGKYNLGEGEIIEYIE